MLPQTFHAQIDKDRLVAALADAQRNTAGRIYVYVSHRPITDALAAARRRFEKLGLSRLHEHRASVLLYFAPKTHKFAIIGDTAIHARCGEEYWKSLADKLSHDLKTGDLMAALLNAIASLKGTLEEHFPLK
jgi:uncharacterized membrane protein